MSLRVISILVSAIAAIALVSPDTYARTQKPLLHGKNWVAITGKPLAASAGARIFYAGGNAVDATCAMLAATSTMWDVLGWGGETQALVYNPNTGKVIGINALGVAPSGATAAFFRDQELDYPPEFGPQAAVTPGTPGGLMVMLAEFGTMSLAEVLAPAIEMADGYPIEASAVRAIDRSRDEILKWSYSRGVFLPNGTADEPEGPAAGEIFRQPDLKATLEKLVAAERDALEAGADRKAAIYAAYDRFYRGDIAEELVRATKEYGGLITLEDLDGWEVKLEEPVKTSYRDIDVYKLTTWTQGPVLLQALNILENFDLKGMGYNSTRYIHTLYQAMNLAYADRDFYYGDPYVEPAEPIAGLLSKAYAKQRAAEIDPERNDPNIGPGDPYEFQDGRNPYRAELDALTSRTATPVSDDAFFRGTTTIQAADKDGWIVSVTPSGGWIPAFVAGSTGIGLSQRMQSFVLDPGENPYNVVRPGQRPRVTLTPSMAFKDGKPFLSFSVQGGDAQDQNLLQFFLNVVEFGMNVQEAAEGDNFLSYQMHGSFGDHPKEPGRLAVNESVSEFTQQELDAMGYDVEVGIWGSRDRTSGPINAIYFDWENDALQGGSSNHGDDYGIAW
jgi:gamma-glutamyltranspeptidase/glutathione hydrolase